MNVNLSNPWNDEVRARSSNKWNNFANFGGETGSSKRGNSDSQANSIRCPGPTPERPRNQRPADKIKFRLPCSKTNAFFGNGYKVKIKFPDTALN